jgi:hypothetical protein
MDAQAGRRERSPLASGAQDDLPRSSPRADFALWGPHHALTESASLNQKLIQRIIFSRTDT